MTNFLHSFLFLVFLVKLLVLFLLRWSKRKVLIGHFPICIVKNRKREKYSLSQIQWSFSCNRTIHSLSNGFFFRPNQSVFLFLQAKNQLKRRFLKQNQRHGKFINFLPIFLGRDNVFFLDWMKIIWSVAALYRS